MDGFIILESSRKDHIVKHKGQVLHTYVRASYHVVFDRPVNWDLNVRAMNWVAMQARNPNTAKYVQMQCIKRSSTLFSKRRSRKSPPRVVYRYGSQNNRIKKFMETRKFILDALDGKEVD